MNHNLPEKVSVLGAGSWGTVLAHILSSSGHNVSLWARSQTFVKHTNQMGRFTKPVELSLPESIDVTNSLKECLENSSMMVCAIPSEGVSQVIKKIKSLKEKPVFILSATKGFDQRSGKRMSELWRESFPDAKIATLSGPNLAAEAALAKPMKTLIGAQNIETAKEACSYFQITHFKTEATADLIGIELCGATKNVIAIAAGAWDALNLGTSGKGAMLSRAMQELAILVKLAGGATESVYSVAGLGDLYITSTSQLSRNYQTGFSLGKGKNLKQINAELSGQVAEGVWTAPLIHRLAQKFKTEFKVCEAVYKMLSLDLSLPENRYKLEEIFIDLI